MSKTPEDIRGTVLAIIAELSSDCRPPGVLVDANPSLRGLGFDSLDVVDLELLIAEQFPGDDVDWITLDSSVDDIVIKVQKAVLA